MPCPSNFTGRRIEPDREHVGRPRVNGQGRSVVVEHLFDAPFQQCRGDTGVLQTRVERLQCVGRIGELDPDALDSVQGSGQRRESTCQE